MHLFLITSWLISCQWRLIDLITGPTKGVHQLRYFLLMNTYCCLLMHKCICIKWDPMRTPMNDGVRIGSHFHKNANMHEQTTISIHEKDQVHVYLNWCPPFVNVSLYYTVNQLNFACDLISRISRFWQIRKIKLHAKYCGACSLLSGTS